MSDNKRMIAAWLGLIGLVSGLIVFAVFVYPDMADEYGWPR